MSNHHGGHYYYSANMTAYDDDVVFYVSRLTKNYEYGPLGPHTMRNFDTHQTICVWIMKFIGVLSMIASYFIIRDIVIRYYNRERIRLTSKVIFELSIGDFFGTFFSAVMGTWMVPKESGAYMAAGSVASCTAQGFLQAFFYGIGITMNAVLAITYYQLVKNERADGTRTKRNTRLILLLPPLIPLLLSIGPLFNNGYNYTDISICGIGEYPLGCLVVFEIFDKCTRGTRAIGMKYLQLSYILLINIIIVTSVVLMICYAKSKDRKMNRSSSLTNSVSITNNNNSRSDDIYAINVRNGNSNNNATSKKFLWQGLWYVACFTTAWFPWYVWQWIRITDKGYLIMNDFQSVSLFYILSITHPSQGFLNALVFFRPSYLKYRYRDEREWRLASICRVLHIPVPRILLVEWWASWLGNRKEEEDVEYDSRIEMNNEGAKPNVVSAPRSACSKSLVKWKEEEEKADDDVIKPSAPQDMGSSS